MTHEPSTSDAFAALGLSEPLVRATHDRGYVAPTPVQSAVIPSVLRGRDVWASAQTGSGKTAAFVLPILESLARTTGVLDPEGANGSAPGARTVATGVGEPNFRSPSRRRSTPRRLGALILVPTRELAAQIGDAVRAYGRHLREPLETRVVFGGVSINPQMMALRGGADVVVATPGRLLDLVSKNALSLASVSTLVLDEADRLLEHGFEDELTRILALLPAERQTLLFSATFPPAVRALASSVLRDPERVEVVSSAADAPAILQRVIEVDRARRTQLLRHLIAQKPSARVLVFVATTYATEHVSDKLRGLGVAAAPIHGKLSQGARTRALADFRDGVLRVLVATDVAARGLDIEGLPMVVNYDLPRSPADYLHRIGRTGRAGESGVAVSFVSADTHAHFRLIERRHGLDLPRERIEGFEPLELEPTTTPTDSAGGIKGKRKSKKDKLREAAAKAEKPGDS